MEVVRVSAVTRKDGAPGTISVIGLGVVLVAVGINAINAQQHATVRAVVNQVAAQKTIGHARPLCL